MVDTDLGQSANSLGHLLCAALMLALAGTQECLIPCASRQLCVEALGASCQKGLHSGTGPGEPPHLRFNFLSEG